MIFFFARWPTELNVSGHMSSGLFESCLMPVSLSFAHVFPFFGGERRRSNVVDPVHADDNSFVEASSDVQ